MLGRPLLGRCTVMVGGWLLGGTSCCRLSVCGAVTVGRSLLRLEQLLSVAVACPQCSSCGHCRKRSAGLCAGQMGCAGQVGGRTWLAGHEALSGWEEMLSVGLGRGVWKLVVVASWLDRARTVVVKMSIHFYNGRPPLCLKAPHVSVICAGCLDKTIQIRSSMASNHSSLENRRRNSTSPG